MNQLTVQPWEQNVATGKGSLTAIPTALFREFEVHGNVDTSARKAGHHFSSQGISNSKGTNR